jgi:polyisoprenoid-binding protein YceI
MNAIRSNRRLAPAVLAALILAFGVVAGASLPRSAAAQDDATTTEGTAPGVLEGEPVAIECDPAVAETPPAAAATTFTIVSEESAARYRAQEELASIGTQEAVGETSAIIGQILFDEAGSPLACSRFDVDLRTLQSDEARRDNFLYENTLETGQYPLATFILTEVEGLDEPLGDGEETTFTLIGNLTFHGVTKPVAWEATATLDGETLTGSAATTFDMADFDIESPTVGPVVSIEEAITLEADITAEQAA